MIDDSSLFHAEKPYDAQKAREYYLRTRKLKGRKKGAGDPEANDSTPGVAKPTGSKHPKAAKTSAQKHKAADAEVAALKGRLEHLKEVLAQLVKGAKARSGVETKTDKAKSKANANRDAKAKTPLTSKQKREAAQRSKDYRKTHKPAVSAKDKNLEEIRAQIKDIRAQLKAAIEKAKNSAPKSKTQTAKAVDTKQEGASQNGS